MGLWLNRFIFFLLILSVQDIFSQAEKSVNNYDDYKDKEQFDKFFKKRRVISAWQIGRLKTGALVVKLKTNKPLIDELIKSGNTSLAKEKQIETNIINKNLMMAYIDNFKFCKLYFINSYSNDSLMNGARAGLFLDTNLTVDPKIVMTEKFYLVAEKDNVYNSSIGFVKEDSARFVKEHGNPSGQMAEAVIKNKYGHQLKKPFPYVCGYGNKSALIFAFIRRVPVFYSENDGKLNYVIDKHQLTDYKSSTKKEFKKKPEGSKTLWLDKEFAYEVISLKISEFNNELNEYYRSSPKLETDKIDQEILPFLY